MLCSKFVVAEFVNHVVGVFYSYRILYKRYIVDDGSVFHLEARKVFFFLFSKEAGFSRGCEIFTFALSHFAVGS